MEGARQRMLAEGGRLLALRQATARLVDDDVDGRPISDERLQGMAPPPPRPPGPGRLGGRGGGGGARAPPRADPPAPGAAVDDLRSSVDSLRDQLLDGLPARVQ